MSLTQYKNTLVKLWLASTLCISGQVLSGPASNLVPFSGKVGGDITLTWIDDGTVNIDSAVDIVANHVGRGTQKTTALDLTQFPWITTGSIVTHTANGDTIELDFVLNAVAIQPPLLVYVGSYVITGGTGRFTPPSDDVNQDLGSGPISGVAELQLPDPATLILSFQHTFEGTLSRGFGDLGKPASVTKPAK